VCLPAFAAALLSHVGLLIQARFACVCFVLLGAGGLHHAKKAECSGFWSVSCASPELSSAAFVFAPAHPSLFAFLSCCHFLSYTNDIVLAILELLRYHPRVLYIDIDVHHGDGVEEAFWLSDRVMTVSFHRHGDGFFPQTGALNDVGVGAGRGYSLNFPLQDGIDDDTYQRLFTSIITNVMANYRPGAIVLQCGADSLTGDKLGPFNLTLRGHGACVSLCKSFGVPLLLLGGGGYTVENVARAWTFETALALGQNVAEDLSPDLPFNTYMHEWGPYYKLHLEPEPGRVNLNDRGELQRIESTLLQQLKEIGGPPSVGYDTRTGRDEGLHGWKEEVSAARAEEARMDSVADGPVGGGKQHRGEFFANNRDQDASDMPPSASMGIVRPKPTVTLNNTVAAAAPSGSAASSASAAAAAPTPSKVLKSEDVAPMEQ
jgi:histone deacetylase 1/2